jgi:hypothetical protein
LAASFNGVLDQVFEKLQSEQIVRIKIEAFSRFEKLDVLFLGFLNFALIIEALR